MATTGICTAEVTARRKTIPRPSSPGCDVVANTCPATSHVAPSLAATRASSSEWTLAPIASPGAARRASATRSERLVSWAPRARVPSARSTRSLTTSHAPVIACAASSPPASVCNRAAGSRPARRCSAPRGPRAAITAHATSMKSSRETISSLVTAWMTGSVATAGAGGVSTVGSSTLPLRGSGRGGVEPVADGDPAAVGPLGGAQPAPPGGLHDCHPDRAAPTGDQHPDLRVHRQHLAGLVRGTARRHPRAEQLHLGATQPRPRAWLRVVGADVPPHLVCAPRPVHQRHLTGELGRVGGHRVVLRLGLRHSELDQRERLDQGAGTQP